MKIKVTEYGNEVNSVEFETSDGMKFAVRKNVDGKILLEAFTSGLSSLNIKPIASNIVQIETY